MPPPATRPRPAAVAARAAYATIEGTGSTWSQIIVDQWIADVDANGIKVVYTGGGSTKGRKDFSQSSVDFAISEIPYQGTDESGQADTSNGRAYSYLPIVAGGTAFTYQLKVGNDLVRNLRLSGETIAKIFTGQITNWNDDADHRGQQRSRVPGQEDHPGGALRRVRHDRAVHDLDGPRVPEHLAALLRPVRAHLLLPPRQAPAALGQSGSDQVMNTISGFAGDGTIGYVEYSYPRNKDYPVVKVLNKGGYYVEPTQYNVAVALTKAKINRTRATRRSTSPRSWTASTPTRTRGPTRSRRTPT